MSRNPRVTVFIPVFNREDYVCTAINSILAQQYTDFEILIVDDGSTDATRERIAAYGDPRVRLECNGRNLGIPASRNRGLALARGEYIALLDSDDYAYPNRLAVQVDYLDRHPELVQIGSGCTLMDAQGRLLKRVRRHPNRPEAIDAHLLFHCALINRTIMARTAILREYGYDERFPRCQDYELHTRLARKHRMANLSRLLVCGREHDGRITKNTRGLGQDRKMAIQAAVLEQLDIAADEQDVLRHYLLTQKTSTDAGDPVAYLEWAEGWLRGLAEANSKKRRFDPQAFRRVLGAIWVVACWHYARGEDSGLMRRLLGSPLARGIPGNLSPKLLAGILINRRRPPALDSSCPDRHPSPQ